MKRIALFIMLVAVLATVAGAESVKKKTIKSVNPQQQQQQVTNVQLSDFDNAINAFFNDDYNTAFNSINKHLKKNPNDPFAWTCLAAIQGDCDNDAEALKAINKARSCPITKNDPSLLIGRPSATRHHQRHQRPEEGHRVCAFGRRLLYAPWQHLQETEGI